MTGNDQEAKNRILKVTGEMLDRGENPDKLTVRKIAEQSGVGIGLINYHFGSKNGLLSMAIGEAMAKLATDYAGSGNYVNISPQERLKSMLENLYKLGEQYEKLIQFQITQDITAGDMTASLFLVPVLKEILNNSKDELELRLIAVQILLPLQVASINPSEFYDFSGINLRNSEQRVRFINKLVDNLLDNKQVVK
ncbi:MAG: TetR/AcrR family transcriptional regulator [Peptococcaceae bacterium]|nr:TetR/AcrR family transcriptional regulator [Peptococcaceae bacterium]